MTTVLPASPKASITAASRGPPVRASVRVAQTIAPLPAASPRRLDHQRLGVRVHVRERGVELGEGRGSAAVGTPAATMTSLAKAFDASIRAAEAIGPKTSRPAARSASASPAASGASGPTMVRSMAWVASRVATGG